MNEENRNKQARYASKQRRLGRVHATFWIDKSIYDAIIARCKAEATANGTDKMDALNEIFRKVFISNESDDNPNNEQQGAVSSDDES